MRDFTVMRPIWGPDRQAPFQRVVKWAPVMTITAYSASHALMLARRAGVMLPVIHDPKWVPEEL